VTAQAPVRRPGRSRVALPWTVRAERRLEVPRWLPVATTVGAVAVALLIGGVILAFAGGDPLAIYAHILRSSFGSLGVLSDTLVKATPLILTGLACALAFRMRLWNIGAEGQLLVGAWAASAIVLIPVVPAGTPSIVTIPLMMVAAMLAGGAYGAIPGILKAAGVNVVRNTIIVFAISGALAGLAGMSEVSGVVHRLQLAISPGYGFTAVIVAYIAKLNPYGVVVAAIAFGALILAGREIQPSGIPAMIQGIILFCLIASEVFLRYRFRIERRAA